MVVLELDPRQINGTDGPTDGSSSFSFESWLADYWFILLIVVAVLVVVCVLICACIVRKHPRTPSSFHIPHSTSKSNSSPDEHGGSSEQSRQSSIPTMPSISGDSTPIPSPHSSQHSVGLFNGNGRNRRTSPRLSSTSSDTLRPDARSMSSNSSASLMGHSPTRQQEDSSLMERRGSLPRRTRSGPMVRVTSMPDVKNNGNMRSAPSTVSVESSSSGKSGVSYKFQPGNDSQTFVEVGVTVHTPGDPDKAVRIATAAALAESARKLAQEAASFIDNEEEGYHPPPLPPQYNRGRAYYLPSGSGRSSSFSMSNSPYVPSRSIPMTTASLDNPSSAMFSNRVGGDLLRGDYPPTSPSVLYYPMQVYPRGPRSNDSDYQTESDLNFHTQSSDLPPGHHFSRHPSAQAPFQRGKPYRSSFDDYRHSQHSRSDRISSFTSSRETSFSGRYPTLPISEELNNHRYHNTGARRSTDSNSNRKIPFHLTAAGRQQSAPSIGRKGLQQEPFRKLSQDRRVLVNPNIIEVPFDLETPLDVSISRSESGKRNRLNQSSNDGKDIHVHIPLPNTKSRIPPETITPLTQSSSTSTGLSSNHSSQLEEGSPHPSQEAPSEIDSVKHTSEVNNSHVENGIHTENSVNTEKSIHSVTDIFSENNIDIENNNLHSVNLLDTSKKVPLADCLIIPNENETETYPNDSLLAPDLTQKSMERTEDVEDRETRTPLSKGSAQSSLESEESVEGPLREHVSSEQLEDQEDCSMLEDQDDDEANHFDIDLLPIHSNRHSKRTSNDGDVPSRHSALPRYHRSNRFNQSNMVVSPSEGDYLSHVSSQFHSSNFPQVHPSQSSSSSSAVNITVNV